MSNPVASNACNAMFTDSKYFPAARQSVYTMNHAHVYLKREWESKRACFGFCVLEFKHTYLCYVFVCVRAWLRDHVRSEEEVAVFV